MVAVAFSRSINQLSLEILPTADSPHLCQLHREIHALRRHPGKCLCDEKRWAS